MRRLPGVVAGVLVLGGPGGVVTMILRSHQTKRLGGCSGQLSAQPGRGNRSSSRRPSRTRLDRMREVLVDRHTHRRREDAAACGG